MLTFTKSWLVAALVLILGLAPAGLAQDECPTLVTEAYQTVELACLDIGLNQVCYGNALLQAMPRTDVSEFSFSETGDLADIVNIETLKLSSMSVNDENWGIAIMKIQANIENTLPGQAVIFVLFGDVEITNAGEATVELSATANRSVNVRHQPTTNADNIVDSLARDETVTANGRLEDDTWIRIRLEDDSNGWVSADFLSVEGGNDQLSIVQPDSLTFGPMQAFSLRTGFNETRCSEAPRNGILVQSPTNTTINMMINGVEIALGSTAFLENTQDQHQLNLYLLEGGGTVTAENVTQPALAGTVVSVPLTDDDTAPAGPPEEPQPYDLVELESLPLGLSYVRQITITSPLAEADIQSTLSPPPGTGVCPSTAFTCQQLFTCDQAFACLQAGNFTLDPDGNNVPCEEQPLNCTP